MLCILSFPSRICTTWVHMTRYTKSWNIYMHTTLNALLTTCRQTFVLNVSSHLINTSHIARVECEGVSMLHRASTGITAQVHSRQVESGQLRLHSGDRWERNSQHARTRHSRCCNPWLSATLLKGCAKRGTWYSLQLLLSCTKRSGWNRDLLLISKSSKQIATRSHLPMQTHWWDRWPQSNNSYLV